MLTAKLEAGETYTSDEHGVRLTIPKGYSSQPPDGPILLERTAKVVECREQAFFITSVVHCFPCSAKFDDDPLLLDFVSEDIGDDSIQDGEFQVRSCISHTKHMQVD